MTNADNGLGALAAAVVILVFMFALMLFVPTRDYRRRLTEAVSSDTDAALRRRLGIKEKKRGHGKY